jgi:hydrogenase maturation protease
VAEGADRPPVLVIGYGNDLRSDDGAGRWVAEQIEAMSLPDVEVRSMMQLTPEVALDVVDRRLVVFVDASVETEEVTIGEIGPRPGAQVTTHHGDPASLLTIGATVGGPPSRAMLVSVPARNLGMGDRFSPPTERATRDAVDLIVAHIDAAR